MSQEELVDRFNAEYTAAMEGSRDSMNNASAEERRTIPIELPGNYLCEVATFAYAKDGKDRQSPEVYISDEKKSLNLTFSLRVVDGTDKVPAGSSIFSNITLCPGGASFDKATADKIMGFTKPKLVALTGSTKIDLTTDWIKEWLLPKFEKSGKTFTLVKDHKMKQRVMVTVDYDKNGKPAVKSILKSLPGDKSITFGVEVSHSNVSIPADGQPAPSFGHVVDRGDVDVAPKDIPHVPDVEEF